MSTHALDPSLPRARSTRALAAEQMSVAGGQLAAGVGNLAFALVAVRLLAPGDFADLAAFLALYLLIHVPTASLSAGSTLRPSLARTAQWRTWLLGGAAGAAVAAAGQPLATFLHLPVELVWALAASIPTAAPIALERGRLYGLGDRSGAVASLVAEPAVRLAVAIPLGAALGPAGAAAGVVLAGWVALLVARAGGGTACVGARDEAIPAEDAARGARVTPHRAATPQPRVAVAAFLLLAVIQSQDVLLANRILPPDEAARFAIVSTLGGIAAFATTTIPLVLMPRAAARERGALPAALAIAAVLGTGAVALVAILSPGELVAAVFGARYESVGALAVPYLIAMALLGVARVLVAHACAREPRALLLVPLAGAAVLQAALIAVAGDSPAAVANATLVATAALTATAAGAAVVRLPVARSRLELLRHPSPVVLAVGAATVAGLALRMLATRSIWLDEATSIHQALMPFEQMLAVLRESDVHPPLHHAVLWATVRVLSDGELAVRMPSIVAGAALVPVLYLLGRDLYDRRAGIAAAALGAVAPLAIWYAQEARMYSLFMLFAAVALWAQVRAVRGGGTRFWLLYAAATAALAWTQYFGLLFVATQQLGFAAAAWRRRGDRARLLGLLRGWVLAAGLIGLALAPLIPFAHDQFAANEAAGKGFEQVPSQAGAAAAGDQPRPSLYGAITNVLWAVWGYHADATMAQLVALWPLALLLAFLLLGRGRSSVTTLLIGCALLPAVALFVLGQAKPFVFEARYFIAGIAIAIVLMARAVTTWIRTPAAVCALTGLLAASLALGFADQQLNGANPRLYDFRSAVQAIVARARPGDTIVYQPDYLGDVIGYYTRGRVAARSLDEGVPRRRPGQRVFVLASFLDKPQFAAATRDAVGRLGRERRIVMRLSHTNIRVWGFA